MKENLYIDANNIYVQGLISLINKFLIEEACGCWGSENRLQKDIAKIKEAFMEERGKMVLKGQTCKFNSPKSDRFNLIFTKSGDSKDYPLINQSHETNIHQPL